MTTIYKQSCNCVSPVAISCGSAPDAPANGQRSGSGTTVGSTVTYTCNKGYTLQGDNNRTCLANGRLSGSAPTCNRKLLGIRCSIVDIHMDINNPSGQCCCSMKTVEIFLNSKANSYRTASGKTVYIQVDDICARCLVYVYESHNMDNKLWSGRAPMYLQT